MRTVSLFASCFFFIIIILLLLSCINHNEDLSSFKFFEYKNDNVRLVYNIVIPFGFSIMSLQYIFAFISVVGVESFYRLHLIDGDI